jgi:hypothetical protein
MNFGCGKFDEAVMLRYVEGTMKLEEAKELDAHLRTCDACLREVMELQRIGAVMDAGEAQTYPFARKIFLWIRDNVLEKFRASFDASALESVPARDKDANGVTGVKFATTDPDSEVTLFPGEKGSFGIIVDARGWKATWSLSSFPAKNRSI